MNAAPRTILDDLLNGFTPALLTHALATGHGIRVALLDSGIDRELLGTRHPGANIAEAIAFRGKTVIAAAESPSSLHGTTVADILLRLAPRVTLDSADVFGPRGTCEVDTLIAAIRHAMDVWNAKIINLSLGVIEARLQPPVKKNRLLHTIEEAYFRDIVVVAAAHNDHPFTRSFPAVFSPPLFSVNKAWFENPERVHYRLNENIEFEAHATGTLGPFCREPATSWASPHLSAVLARLLSLKPTLKPFELKAILYWLSEQQDRFAAESQS